MPKLMLFLLNISLNVSHHVRTNVSKQKLREKGNAYRKYETSLIAPTLRHKLLWVALDFATIIALSLCLFYAAQTEPKTEAQLIVFSLGSFGFLFVNPQILLLPESLFRTLSSPFRYSHWKVALLLWLHIALICILNKYTTPDLSPGLSN